LQKLRRDFRLDLMREYRLEVMANDSFDIQKEIAICQKQRNTQSVGGTLLNGIGVRKLKLLLSCDVEYMSELRGILEFYKEGLGHWNNPAYEFITSEYASPADFIYGQVKREEPQSLLKATQIFRLYNNKKLNSNQKGHEVLTKKLERWSDEYWRVRHERLDQWYAFKTYMMNTYTKERYIQWRAELGHHDRFSPGGNLIAVLTTAEVEAEQRGANVISTSIKDPPNAESSREESEEVTRPSPKILPNAEPCVKGIPPFLDKKTYGVYMISGKTIHCVIMENFQ
jgi:hypothetical protein